MRALILGAAGMLGRKLASSLLADPQIGDAELSGLALADVVAPAPDVSDAGVAVACHRADLSTPGAAEPLIASRPEVIFHLAAVVSGQAEAEFDLGYSVNVDGTRALFEAVRRAGGGYRPRLVFASSLAVFGGPYPARGVPDDFHVAPQSCYGAQKAIGELLIGDYSRRGFLDGVAIRLPTICVRPGTANAALSSFLSSIVREPLAGRPAQIPVPDTLRHWVASPQAAIGFLRHAAALPSAQLGARRAITMPGLSVSAREQVATLARVAGAAVARRVERRPDPTVTSVVQSWPGRFAARRAEQLGFTANASFEEILREYIADELGGTWVR